MLQSSRGGERPLCVVLQVAAQLGDGREAQRPLRQFGFDRPIDVKRVTHAVDHPRFENGDSAQLLPTGGSISGPASAGGAFSRGGGSGSALLSAPKTGLAGLASSAGHIASKRLGWLDSRSCGGSVGGGARQAGRSACSCRGSTGGGPRGGAPGGPGRSFGGGGRNGVPRSAVATGGGGIGAIGLSGGIGAVGRGGGASGRAFSFSVASAVSSFSFAPAMPRLAPARAPDWAAPAHRRMVFPAPGRLLRSRAATAAVPTRSPVAGAEMEGRRRAG